MNATKPHSIRYGLIATCMALLFPCSLSAQNTPAASEANPVAATDGPLVLAPLEGDTAPPSDQAAEPVKAPPPPALKSVLMPKDMLKKINMASNIYHKYSTQHQQDLTAEERQFMAQIVGLSGGKRPQKHQTKRYAYPQYFLELLDYHSDSDWLVYLSGTKITPQTHQDNAKVKVMGVSKESIKLQWVPKMMAKFTDHLPNPPDPNVQVNKNKGQIIVTLHPHQTFSSYAMRVLEGKVEPKIITAEAGDFPDGQELANAPAPAAHHSAPPRRPPPGPVHKPAHGPAPSKKTAPPGAKPGDANQGMTGLINNYQNSRKNP